ncbi:MAG: hypothetical protein NZL92_00595 [Gloeomargarita sp. SKYG116]|nr:hypothetical protein [Gloeomargarita sp. SKYG116]MDW8400175.1 hypothetical protein [Gloeomargarita sp. SKYGB_i_bin116]
MGLAIDVWREPPDDQLWMYLEALGDCARTGYCRYGRGLVWWVLDEGRGPVMDFLPGNRLLTWLETLALDDTGWSLIAEAVGTYHPQREMVVLRQQSGQLRIYRLPMPQRSQRSRSR